IRRTLPLLTLAAVAALAVPAAAQEQPPAPGPLRPYQVPGVQDFRLDNGVRVVVVPQTSLPIVHGRVLVTAGAVYDPPAKSGLASLTGSLLDEGVQGMTGAELAARMEQLGAQFFTGAGYASSFAQVTAVKSAFAEALDLAAKAITQPTFPEAEFTRVRNEALAGAAQRQSTVEGLSYEAFARALFAPSAPYSRLPTGTRATIPTITREDVVAWHRAMYSPANTTVLLVGDLSVNEARAMAQHALGAWRAPAPTLPAIANPTQPVSATRVILVDRPGSVQSGVYVGQAAIGQTDPRYFAFDALSQVLGGGFKARLNTNLRERHGWTYGAFTSFQPLEGVGTFAISTTVRTNATDSALVESVKEIRRIATEPVPDAELRGTLANIVGSFPNSVQTVQGLAGRMERVILYGLPLDFWGTYRERQSAITAADVGQVGRAVLKPDALTIVVAGDLSKIEAPVRALNLGAVEVWDASGTKVR
ncbi:MAG TPA: pitrilysin family protein, partial [Longimicrobium sp.]|nr:pitrilysin family protein [Longimicrobium sp.]